MVVYVSFGFCADDDRIVPCAALQNQRNRSHCPQIVTGTTEKLAALTCALIISDRDRTGYLSSSHIPNIANGSFHST